MKPTFEVAHILNNQWQSIIKGDIKINSWQLRTLNAIKDCRTSRLGGHIDSCTLCGHLSISYNSCRNRHCPKCQGEKRDKWIDARKSELLPVKYFHVVFTLPECVNSLVVANHRLLYNILIRAAWDTTQDFSKDTKWIGGKMGMTSILLTWGQNLSLHPHLHCIIPGGGVTKRGRWKSNKKHGKILFPVKALSKVFRGKFIHYLKKELVNLSPHLENQMYKYKWVVYAKQPFGGPHQVIEYLGRYTHKIAISNHRIIDINNGIVSFTYKDYKYGGVKKMMKLTEIEFIRRFSMHILPKGFVRIRHFGILSSTWKKNILKRLQESLDFIPPPPLTKNLHLQCPKCKTPTIVTLQAFNNKGPPEIWKKIFEIC